VVVRRADVAVMKSGMELSSGDPTFAEFGGLIRYKISYNNIGSITAHNVVIDEIVPDNTQLVSVNAPPGATVTYSPNELSATSFSVLFDTLTAPANFVRSAVGSSGADNTPPTLDSVGVDCVGNTLTLTFSERMEFDRATSLSSYKVSGGVTLQGLDLSADGRTVSLLTSPMLSSNNYVLTVSNVTDVAGNFMTTNAIVNLHCPTGPVVATNCCGDCANRLTNTITFQSGLNYLVMPPCIGAESVLFFELLLNPPDRFRILRWAGTGFSINSYSIDFGERDMIPILSPGEAFIVFSPEPFTLTFVSCEPVSLCPLPCTPHFGLSMVGRYGIGEARYTNLFSCAPRCGTELLIPNNQSTEWDLGYTKYTYLNGAWTPQSRWSRPTHRHSSGWFPSRIASRCYNPRMTA